VRGNRWETFGLQLVFVLPISLLYLVAELVPPPGTQIIDFIASLQLGWLYAAFTMAFLPLAPGVRSSIGEEHAGGPGRGTN
jgi:hypothetical protein